MSEDQTRQNSSKKRRLSYINEHTEIEKEIGVALATPRKPL